MGVLQSAQQAVSDIAGSVVDTAKSAAASSVTQIAKTPLDILEELLGGAPGADGVDKQSLEEQGQTIANTQALQKQSTQDEEFRQQKHQQLHDQIQQQSTAYYQQKSQAEEQKHQAQSRQEEQKKFEIKQLEKQKKENLAVQMAKDSASAEKRVGAG